MTRVQFILMILADSYDELESAMDKINTILRGRQIEVSDAPWRQEQAFDSCLPIGNSCGIDHEHNIQVRRTLDTDSTAIFMPFNARELLHEGGIYFGQNKLSRSIILFDRSRLNNPNTFIFGMPGSGKSMLAKLIILYIYLSQNDEILIVDPEREYAALVELLGGEVIYMSANSGTHINPLDLTENPDSDDKEYNPVKAKPDFLLSFFSAIMGDIEITPIQKTIIDSVMHAAYSKIAREIDFIASMDSKKIYIQSAFALPDEDKAAQELTPLALTNDSFPKIVVHKDICKRWYNDSGVLNIGLTFCWMILQYKKQHRADLIQSARCCLQLKYRDSVCFENPNRVVKMDIGWRQSIVALFQRLHMIFAEKDVTGEMSNITLLNKKESLLNSPFFRSYINKARPYHHGLRLVVLM